MFLTDYIFQLLQCIIPLLLAVYAYFKWSRQYWERRNVPYLEPKSFLGNIVDLVGDDISELYNKVKSKGWKYCGLYILSRPVLLLLDLDIIKHILSTDFHNFVDRGIFVNEKDEPIGAHLFAVGGTKWRNLRQKFSPQFSTAKLRNILEIQLKCCQTMENYLIEQSDLSEPIDVKAIMSSYTLDVIGSSAFGIECNNFKQLDSSPFRKYGELIFSKSLGFKVKLYISEVFPKLAQTLRFTMFRGVAKTFFHNLIVETVKYREKNNIERNDFLQMMINLKNQGGQTVAESAGDGSSLRLNELLAQCFVFFNAGFETTATTLTFCLYELAVHPEIQEKVRNEIFEALTKHKEVNYETLKELKYMEQVINETLRKYSPLPFITRVCVEDYKVPGHGLTIEKGTKIFIPVKAVHYDDQYYEEPEKFDPNRFLSEKLKERHQYTHLPFGEGPRMCVGVRMGKMTTKIGLLTVLKNFRVTLNEKTRVPLQLSSRYLFPAAEGGIWLNFERSDRQTISTGS